MKLEDRIYTKKELRGENLKFISRRKVLVTYQDNVGNQYFFVQLKRGLHYHSTMKNIARICSGWGK